MRAEHIALNEIVSVCEYNRKSPPIQCASVVVEKMEGKENNERQHKAHLS